MTNTLYTSAGYGRLRILHWKCSGLSDVNEVETLNDGHDCSFRRKSGWDVSLRRKMGLLLSTSIKDLLDGTTWYPDSKKIFVCLQSLWVVALLSSSRWSTHDIRVGVKRHFSSLVLWLKHTLLMPGAPLSLELFFYEPIILLPQDFHLIPNSSFSSLRRCNPPKCRLSNFKDPITFLAQITSKFKLWQKQWSKWIVFADGTNMFYLPSQLLTAFSPWMAWSRKDYEGLWRTMKDYEIARKWCYKICGFHQASRPFQAELSRLGCSSSALTVRVVLFFVPEGKKRLLQCC